MIDRFLALFAAPKYTMASVLRIVQVSDANDDDDEDEDEDDDDDDGAAAAAAAAAAADADDDVTVKTAHLISPQQKMVSTIIITSVRSTCDLRPPSTVHDFGRVY
jgi:hypothetical protein